MIFLGIVFFELLTLFLLSRQITSLFGVFFLRLTKSQTIAIRLLAVLFLPGTIIHELSHMLMALLLFVRVGEMEFMPQLQGEHVKLGSVQIAKTDPLRRALIGVSPVLIGLLVMGSVYFTLLSDVLVDFLPYYIRLALALFVVFQIANTMFSSRKDMEGTVEVIVAIVVIVALLYLVGVRLPIESIGRVVEYKQVQDFLQQASLYLLVPIGIDGGVIGISRIVRR